MKSRVLTTSLCAALLASGALAAVGTQVASATSALPNFVEKTIYASILSDPVADTPVTIDTVPGGDLVVTTRSYPDSDGIVQLTRMHANGTGSSVATLASTGMPYVNHDLLVQNTSGVARVLISSPNITYVEQHPALAWSSDGATVYFVAPVQDHPTWSTVDSVPYGATNATPTVIYTSYDPLGAIQVTSDSIYVKDELTNKVWRMSLTGTPEHLLGPAINGERFTVSGNTLYRWNPDTNELTRQTTVDDTTTVISHPTNVLALTSSASGDPVVLSTGASTLVGYSLFDGSPFAFGPPAAPTDVAVSATGSVYVTDQVAGKLFQIDPSAGTASTVVAGIGSTLSGTVDDATVPSPFHQSHAAPMPLAIAPNGDLYVGDLATGHVDKVSGGTRTQLPGTFQSPTGLRISNNKLLVADSLAKTTTIEGLDGSSPTTINATLGATTLDPWVTTPIPSSTDLVTVDNFRDCVVRTKAAGGTGTALVSVDVCTGPSESGLFGATSAVVSSDGYLYVADAGKNRIVRMHTDGTGFQVVATSIAYPQGLAIDAAGDLWVAARGGLFEYLPPVTLTASASSVQIGSTIRITAHANAVTSDTPEYVVDFYQGFNSAASSRIVNCASSIVHSGTTFCDVALPKLGPYTFSATLIGPGSTRSYSTPITVHVIAAPTTVTTTVPQPTVAHRVRITLGATVTSTAPFGVVNSGYVVFYDGRSVLSACSKVFVHSGNASCTTSFVATGNHALSTHYIENVHWANGTSASVTLKVT